MRSSLIAFGLLFVGCADTGAEGMFVLNNTAPSGDACTLTGERSQPFLPSGAILAGVSANYVLTPLIQSRITALEGRELERTIHLEGADIVLSSVATDGTLTQMDEFTSLFSGSVSPLGTTNVVFPVIPASIVSATTTRTTVSASVKVFGTLGGGRIEGEPFNYTVTICTNCILRDNGPCDTAPMAMNEGNPCNVFQDFVVDCCQQNNALICPGPKT